MSKMKKIDWKLVKPDGAGIVHNSRQDAINIRIAINKLIEIINQLIDKNNELEDRINNLPDRNSLPI